MKSHEVKGGRTFKFSSGKHYIVQRRRMGHRHSIHAHEWIVTVCSEPEEGWGFNSELTGWGKSAREAFEDARHLILRSTLKKILGENFPKEKWGEVKNQILATGRQGRRLELRSSRGGYAP